MLSAWDHDALRTRESSARRTRKHLRTSTETQEALTRKLRGNAQNHHSETRQGQDDARGPAARESTQSATCLLRRRPGRVLPTTTAILTIQTTPSYCRLFTHDTPCSVSGPGKPASTPPDRPARRYHGRCVFDRLLELIPARAIRGSREAERKGLLEPGRTHSGNDLMSLHRIGELLDLGLNLAGIRMVLELEAAKRRLDRVFRTSRAPAEGTAGDAGPFT